MKYILLLMSLFFVLSTEAAPASDAATQNASAQRLREFPVTTLKKHRETILPQNLAQSKNAISPDARAISWAFNLEYEGTTQPIASERKKLVDFVVHKNPQLKGQYQYEILVSDGEENFWLPVQNDVLSQFKKEILKKGDKLFAHTRYFGSYYDKTPKQFFLMLGYRKAMNIFSKNN